MASGSILLSEEQLCCAICLDVFTDPISAPCGHTFCRTCITRYWDTSDVCQCPLCTKIFNTRPEVSVNICISEMVHRFRGHNWKEEYEAKVHQMIQERQVKIREVKRSVEISRKDADAVIAIIANSGQVFNGLSTSLISCNERSRAELIGVIEENHKTTEKQAEGFIKDLQKEITQLERIINTPLPTKDWTKVNVHHSSHVGTLRTAVAQLEKTLSQEMEKKLCDAELRRIQRYAVDVTLDPLTANTWLILSEDGKQMSCGDIGKKLPDSTQRFSQCPCVLGKQSFSGRFYYEVQVKGKTDWDLGVARESVNRKGLITVTPNNGYWSIRLRNGNEYMANAVPPVLLPVREKVQKVGVFVDYEEGLVSFYDVEARVHLYSFIGCTFTEKLYPLFSPCINNGGTNSAPLIISPVNMDAGLNNNDN